MNLPRIFLFFPLSAIYWAVTCVRNFLYDKKILHENTFKLPIIGVGNLSSGGAGKTPLVEYIIKLLLKSDYKVATLSRGYKRTTKGYILSNHDHTSIDIGDEAYQVKRKFDDAYVAVCENRVRGIRNLIVDVPELHIVILDDSFQHRAVKPGINILVTEYERHWYNEIILPSGNLRESHLGYKRADVIVVTKSPIDLKDEKARNYVKRLNPYHYQKVFFSHVVYSSLRAFNNFPDTEFIDSHKNEYTLLLFTGIGNAKPYIDHLKKFFREVLILKFSDHHSYSVDDFEMINSKFNSIQVNTKIVLTTEKDISRIENTEEETFFKTLPLYYIPIEVSFRFDDEILNQNNQFDKKILDYVRNN